MIAFGLLEQAGRARRLAESLTREADREQLRRYAAELEAKAQELFREQDVSHRPEGVAHEQAQQQQAQSKSEDNGSAGDRTAAANERPRT